MKTRKQGIISLSLKSVRLQLATVLDEAGGNDALEILDLLADFKPEKREAITKSIIDFLSELKKKEPEFKIMPNDVEKQLMSDILKEIDAFAERTGLPISNAEQASGQIIDLASFRKNRIN